jgi:hypothetical protein
MVQTPLASGQPTAPPGSPIISPSKHFLNLSDAQELFKAVMDVQMASAHAPKCTCSHTPPEDLSDATSTDLCSPTPCPPFPANQPLAQIVTSEHVQQFLDILKSFSAQQGPPPKLPGAKPDAPEDAQPKIAPASKLEFKTVNEVYVSNGIIKLWLTIHLGGMRKILNIKSRNLQQQR